MPEPIHELVRRAQAGDREAFEEMARRYRPGLVALAFLRTGDRDEAEDLAQDALLAAWTRLHQLQEPALFGPWLRAVARNACASWCRRRRPWPRSLDADTEALQLADPAPGPLDAALERERQRAWRRALATLPEPNRVALLMRVWGGSSYAEIADFLGVPVTTIEGRIHRAKAQLRRILRSGWAELLGEPRPQWQRREDHE